MKQGRTFNQGQPAHIQSRAPGASTRIQGLAVSVFRCRLQRIEPLPKAVYLTSFQFDHIADSGFVLHQEVRANGKKVATVAREIVAVPVTGK